MSYIKEIKKPLLERINTKQSSVNNSEDPVKEILLKEPELTKDQLECIRKSLELIDNISKTKSFHDLL